MAASFSLAGAHLKVYVNSKLLGIVTSIPAWNITTAWARLQEIDSVVTNQLAPRMYTCSGTIQVLRGRSTGGLEGAGLVPAAQSMLLQKYLTIEVQDIVTQDIVFRALQCQVTQQQWQINPKGLVMGTFSFEGITASNESEQ